VPMSIAGKTYHQKYLISLVNIINRKMSRDIEE